MYNGCLFAISMQPLVGQERSQGGRAGAWPPYAPVAPLVLPNEMH